MNKTGKTAIIAVAIAASLLAVGVISTQSNRNAATTNGTPSVSNSPSSSINGQTLPVSLGTQVTVDKGNITATAVDPHSGRVYIIYYKTIYNVTDLYISHSDDGGKTFSAATRVNDIPGDVSADDSSPPVIKVAPTGDVYVSWIYTDYGQKWISKFIYGYALIRVSHSSDGGQTFGKAVHVDQEEYGSWAQYAQDIGVSADGKTVYVAWINSNGAGDSGNFTDLIMVSKSTDGAQTFGKAVAVDGANPACSCCKVNVAVDNNGAVYISWRKLYQAPESTHTPPRDYDYAYRQIVVARSTDGGQSFSTPVKVYDDKFLYNSCVMSGAQMAFDSKNNLHIVWYTGTNTTGFLPGSYYAVSSDGGQSFGKPIPLVAQSQVGPSLEYLAIDSHDNTWVVWDDRTGQNNTMWMYNELPATKIDVAKISPDGAMTKAVLNLGDGKLPGIIALGDKVSIVWNARDQSVRFASLSAA